MAHFAIVDKKTNVVKQVIVVSDEKLLDEKGFESEVKGIEFLNTLYSHVDNFDLGSIYFKQTSYNSAIRKNFAGIGFTYSERLDGFIASQPMAPKLIPDPTDKEKLIEDIGEWVLNEKTCQWEWVSASTTQNVFRRMVNTVSEIPSKITNIVTPTKEQKMEKYTGSYWRFTFVDSRNWTSLLAAFILYTWPTIQEKIMTGSVGASQLFAIPSLLLVWLTIKTYRDNKKGQSS